MHSSLQMTLDVAPQTTSANRLGAHTLRATPPGGLRIGNESVGGLSLRASFRDLRQACRSRLGAIPAMRSIQPFLASATFRLSHDESLQLTSARGTMTVRSNIPWN